MLITKSERLLVSADDLLQDLLLVNFIAALVENHSDLQRAAWALPDVVALLQLFEGQLEPVPARARVVENRSFRVEVHVLNLDFVVNTHYINGIRFAIIRLYISRSFRRIAKSKALPGARKTEPLKGTPFLN